VKTLVPKSLRAGAIGKRGNKPGGNGFTEHHKIRRGIGQKPLLSENLWGGTTPEK